MPNVRNVVREQNERVFEGDQCIGGSLRAQVKHSGPSLMAAASLVIPRSPMCALPLEIQLVVGCLLAL